MTGEPSAGVDLGAVVYARVSGYPWWPAIVGKCPLSSSCMKGDKVWVFFFNDTRGAWMKLSQIRTFDRYNHELCRAHNASVPKFRRYQEGIENALSDANAHLKQCAKAVRVKVLPPKTPQILHNEGPPSTFLANVNGTDRQEGPNAKGAKRTTRPVPNDSSLPVSHYLSEGIAHSSEKKSGLREERPKRKRMRSTRYALPSSQLTEKPVTETHDRFDDYGEVTSAWTSNEAARGGLSEKHKSTFHEVPKSTSLRSLRKSSRSRLEPNDTDRNGNVPTRKRGRRSSSIVHDDCPMGPVQADRSDADTVFGASGLRDQKGRNGKPPLANGALNRYSFSGGIDSIPGNFRTSMLHFNRERASCRLPAGNPKREHPTCVRDNESTDSEEDPETRRKVNTGSLEVAIEELMEQAILNNEKESSRASNEMLHSHCLAFNNSELVSSVLSRLSAVEKDVKQLKATAATDSQASLGEDATAAGLKTAVEALASASAAFAEARDYNPSTIRKSVELLWPNGHFPLAGADGELLRTVAESLILASCKRRKVRLESERKDRLGEQQEKAEAKNPAGERSPEDGTPISEEDHWADFASSKKR